MHAYAGRVAHPKLQGVDVSVLRTLVYIFLWLFTCILYNILYNEPLIISKVFPWVLCDRDPDRRGLYSFQGVSVRIELNCRHPVDVRRELGDLLLWEDPTQLVSAVLWVEETAFLRLPEGFVL